MNLRFAHIAAVFGVAALSFVAVAPIAKAAAMLVIETVDGATELTREDIDGFEQIEIATENDFSDGVASFSGPRARDVIAASGAALEGIGVFVAANDYKVEIPLRDFVEYDVIFATAMNGKRLSLRDKGPIWVIYPMTDNKELQDPAYNQRLVWQLVKIEVK